MVERRELDRARSLMGEDEFRAFYDRTARPLWAYLSRLTGDRHQADDLLQEAFYRFYRAGSSYESEAHRRNALFQIATNVARDAGRSARRKPEVPLPEESAGGPVPQSVAPAPDVQVAVTADLAKAMGHLQPLQREMLWLAYAQGASHEEIAEVLGIRAVSVRTLLLRARRKLAGVLSGLGQGRSREARR
jgi:RNA polymerase sigma-70 factor (ECF subfamily)